MSAPISRGEVIAGLARRGFRCVDEAPRDYAESWRHPNGELVNVKCHNRFPLVIHPRHAPRVPALLGTAGVERGKRTWAHNSNFYGFPKRINTGRTEIHYGLDFGFASDAALAAFLDALLKPASTP